MNLEIKPLAEGGKCPDCGNAQFLLAEDVTQYTLVYQDATDPEDPWCYDERDTQPIESVNGEPTVRLFCTECGCHVVVPEEMQ